MEGRNSACAFFRRGIYGKSAHGVSVVSGLLRKTEAGSYTVEAAIIMSIVLSVLYMYVWVSFSLHDRQILYGAALLNADTVRHRQEEPVTAEGKLDAEQIGVLPLPAGASGQETGENTAVYQTQVQSGVLAVRLTGADFSCLDGHVRLSYAAEIPLPFGPFMRRLFPDGTDIEGTVLFRERMQPEELVRITGGIFRRE